MGDGREIVEYGAFNDAHFWEPMFASGELPETMRGMLDDPQNSGLSLWHVYKWAELGNSVRAADINKVDKVGLYVIKKRLVVEFPWEPVEQAEIEAVRRT